MTETMPQVTELLCESPRGEQRRFLLMGLEDPSIAISHPDIPKIGDENPYVKSDPPMKCHKIVSEPHRGRMVKIYAYYQ